MLQILISKISRNTLENKKHEKRQENRKIQSKFENWKFEKEGMGIFLWYINSYTLNQNIIDYPFIRT